MMPLYNILQNGIPAQRLSFYILLHEHNHYLLPFHILQHVLRELPGPPKYFLLLNDNNLHQLLFDNLRHDLLIHYLLRHGEINLVTAADICQQHEREARESMRRLDSKFAVLESHSRGMDTKWRLRAEVERRLTSDTSPTRSRQAQMEAAISTILRVLRERHERGEPGLSNAEIRDLTSLDREQVKYVMRKIRQDGMVTSSRGAGAVWTYIPNGER